MKADPLPSQRARSIATDQSTEGERRVHAPAAYTAGSEKRHAVALGRLVGRRVAIRERGAGCGPPGMCEWSGGWAVRLTIICLSGLPGASTSRAQDRVADTVHNLSASGPGQVRAVSEQQVCIFCHAPHNTEGVRPLWNRELPLTSYTIYQSSTLDAVPGQPTGASKLCLSCHDGTIALGSVLSRADRIRMNGGDFMPAGLTNLGTDLSDDHPISFAYTSGLAASDLQLASPQSLPATVRLDEMGQLQCTACHDAHDNQYGNFLVMRNEFGALCTTCHVMGGWPAGSHRNSNRSITASQGTDWPYATVSENACRCCHRPHTAGGHERLLIFGDEEDNCLVCHDGQGSTWNILTQLDKYSAHDPRLYNNVHDPAELPSVDQPHVECTDCHNPHAVSAQPAVSGYIPIGATLSKVGGVTSGGAYVAEAQYEYQVCFRCHGDTAVDVPGRITRLSQTANLRLRFSATNPSFHPVVGPAAGADVVSLVPGLAPGSMIRCTDCHNSDDSVGAGGGGAKRSPRLKLRLPTGAELHRPGQHERSLIRIRAVLQMPPPLEHPVQRELQGASQAYTRREQPVLRMP